ncbi:hypothetical protein I3760_10G131100 [Carya illinoinensis]|nr:hypothetical protein I3760_10G131100 [Carya illinoinensis]
MVRVKEEAHSTRLRVFNWNQRLEKFGRRPSGLSDTQGLFFFTMKTDYTISILGEGIVDANKRHTEKVVPFEHLQLLSPDSTEMLSRSVLSATDQFLPETVQPLGGQISDFLLRHYRFSPDRLAQPVSPRIVIVVEVSRNRIVEFCSREEMGRMEEYKIPPSFNRWDVPAASDLRRIELDPLDGVYDPEEHRNDPSLFYSSEILCILDSIAYMLETKNAFPTRPITLDDPLGFVPVPVELTLLALEESLDGTCAICLEWFTLVGDCKAVELARTPCNHIFHLRCINQWFHKELSCPMCRFKL